VKRINYYIENWTELTKKKKTEEGLLEFRKELFKMLDIIPIVAFFKDTKNRFVYANNSYCQILGFKKEDLEGKSSVEIFPNQAEYCWSQDKIVIESRKPQRSIVESLDTPLGTKWLVTDKLPIMNENGNLDGILGFSIDITKQKIADRALKDSKAELQKQKEILEKKNIALNELLDQVEKEKNKMKKDILININELVMPILSRLKMNSAARKNADLLETLLKKITSSFGSRLIEKKLMLTPKEIEICNMIKNGLRNKEMSGLLNISSQTVATHRRSIRHKLGISNKPVNLATFLDRF